MLDAVMSLRATGSPLPGLWDGRAILRRSERLTVYIERKLSSHSHVNDQVAVHDCFSKPESSIRRIDLSDTLHFHTGQAPPLETISPTSHPGPPHPLPQPQHLLRIIIDDIRDAHRRHHLQQVRRQPLPQAPPPLPPHGLHRAVPPAIIHPRMDRRALALQSRPQQVHGVYDARAQSAGERADARGGEV